MGDTFRFAPIVPGDIWKEDPADGYMEANGWMNGSPHPQNEETIFESAFQILTPTSI